MPDYLPQPITAAHDSMIFDILRSRFMHWKLLGRPEADCYLLAQQDIALLRIEAQLDRLTSAANRMDADLDEIKLNLRVGGSHGRR